MNRNKFIKIASLSAFAGLISCKSTTDNNNCKTPDLLESVTYKKGHVYYYLKDLKKPFKVLFLSDCHITLEDERGKPFYDYAKRMGGAAVKPENYGESNGRESTLLTSLEKAKNLNVDLVLLGGDIINFPSKASVEFVKGILDKSGLSWRYVSGNHDWHYEGEKGTSFELREKWIQESLTPLYQNTNPLYSSYELNGINFIMIENSTFEITNEQFSFFKKEVEKGLPIILTMHIPLYLPGHNIDYGCGNPCWKQANDTYYKIEKRIPWPAEGHSETTYAFRKLVFDSKNVIGICAGHTHNEVIDSFRNKLQIVAGSNFNGADIVIHFEPYNAEEE